MPEVYDPEEKKLQETYHLKCKVSVKAISYLDEQSKETVARTDEMVFLIPVHSTQMELFFNAWLPEDPDSHNEVAMRAGHPIYGYFKGAVQRRNKNCKEHHIFVMSRGAEEDLKLMNDRDIVVEILPANQEFQADYMRDYTLVDNKSNQVMEVDTRPPNLEP